MSPLRKLKAWKIGTIHNISIMYMAQFNQFEGNENVIEKLKKRSTDQQNQMTIFYYIY